MTVPFELSPTEDQPVAELAVSNICWPDGPEAHAVAMDVFRAHGVTAMDIAPTKAFPELMGGTHPDDIDRDGVVAFRRSLRAGESDRGPIRIAGFQSLTFGVTTETIFGSPEDSKVLHNRVRGMIDLAEFIGARTLIYGSPKTRLIEGLSEDEVASKAASFFGPLGQIAASRGVVLGIEPVSKSWTGQKAVFGNTAADVVAFAETLRSAFDIDSVRLVPDSFAMHDGADDIPHVLRRAHWLGLLAAHAQMAEPGMEAPQLLDDPLAATHAVLADSLRGIYDAEINRGVLPPSVLAVEMSKPCDKNGNPLQGDDLYATLSGVISAAKAHYGQVL